MPWFKNSSDKLWITTEDRVSGELPTYCVVLGRGVNDCSLTSSEFYFSYMYVSHGKNKLHFREMIMMTGVIFKVKLDLLNPEGLPHC